MADNSTYGMIASFETPGQIMKAAKAVCDKGYKNFDTFTPFPVHGMDKAMGMRDTRLPWIVLCMGITGALTGLGLQYWTMSVAYPFIVSGKPYFSLPAFIPIIFELTILFSAFGAFFGMWIMNRLPQLYHPVFKTEVFSRITRDRFYIAIEATDKKYNGSDIRSLLESLGAESVEELES